MPVRLFPCIFGACALSLIIAALPRPVAAADSPWTPHYKPSGTLPEWVYRDQMRQLHAHWDTSLPPGYRRPDLHALWARVREAGFNTVYQSYWRRPPPKDPQKNDETYIFQLAELREDARAAKELGLHFFCGINAFGYHERFAARDAGTQEAVNGQGSTALAMAKHPDCVVPCFLEDAYWDVVVRAPFLEMARMSLEPDLQIDGLDWDPEAYGTKYVFGPYPNNRNKKTATCFCDQCFNRYFEARGIPLSRVKGEKEDPLASALDEKRAGDRSKAERAADTLIADQAHPQMPERTGHAAFIEPENRYDWLKEQDLLDDYSLYLCERLKGILDRIYKDVHAINPTLVVTSYPGIHRHDPHGNWFLTAVYEAYAANPPSLARESTYAKGATRRLQLVAPEYRDKLGGLPVVHGPYMRDWHYEEANYAQACKLFTVGNPGYWAYKESRISERYLARLKAINDPLDRAMATVGGALYPPTAEQEAMVAYEALPWVRLAVPEGKADSLERTPPHGVPINENLALSKANVAGIETLGPEADAAGFEVLGTIPRNLEYCDYFAVRQAPKGLVAQLANTEGCHIHGRLRFRNLPGERFRVMDPLEGIVFLNAGGTETWSPDDLRGGLVLHVPTRSARWVFVEPLGDNASEAPMAFSRQGVRDLEATLAAATAHWQSLGLETLVSMLYGGRPRNLLSDIGTDPTEMTMRVPEPLIVSFERDTAHRSLWNWRGNVVLERGRADDGDRSMRLAAGRSQPPPTLQQGGIVGDFREGKPVALTFRGSFRSEQGGRIQLRLLDENGKATVAEPCVLTVKPAREFLPYEQSLPGTWKQDASRVTFELQGVEGEVFCDALVLMQGEPDNPVPARTRAFVVNRKGTGRYAILGWEQAAGTFVPSAIRFGIDMPDLGGNTFDQQFFEWLSARYVVAFVGQPFRPEFGTFPFRVAAEQRVEGRDAPLVEEKPEPDGEFTIKRGERRPPNLLDARLVGLDAEMGDAFVRENMLGIEFAPAQGTLMDFPDVVLEIVADRYKGMTHLQAVAVTETGMQRPLACHRCGLAPPVAPEVHPLALLIRASELDHVAKVVFLFIPRTSDDRVAWYTVDAEGQATQRRFRLLQRRKGAPGPDAPLVEHYALADDPQMEALLKAEQKDELTEAIDADETKGLLEGLDPEDLLEE